MWIVGMKEGPLLLSNIVGCNPQEVWCGMSLKVTKRGLFFWTKVIKINQLLRGLKRKVSIDKKRDYLNTLIMRR
jgi:hypothetical protein